MRLIFASGARDPHNLAPTSERLVNFYPVPAPAGSIGQFMLRSVLGTRAFAPLSGPFLRAMVEVGGTLYAVSSGALYRVPESGTPAYIAAVTDDPNTSMAGNRDTVTIAAGSNYYLWDGTILSQPGNGRLSDVRSVAFSKQFTLLAGASAASGLREIEWTEAGLPAVRNGLYMATAEGKDDQIVRLMECDGYVYVMKERSFEVWGAAGSGDTAFQRAAVRNIGLLGYHLVAQTPKGLFFVGADRVAYFLSGTEAAPVSTPNVDDVLARATPSHVFYYEDRGHRMCCVRFDDRPAWCYDASMSLWHERSSGVDHGPWDVIASAFCYGRWHLGSRLGAIYRLDTTPVDVTGAMRRTAVSQPLYADGAPFIVSKLELLGRFGANYREENAPNWLTTEYGHPILEDDGQYLLADDPQPVSKISAPVRLWLRLSRDKGYTWGAPKLRDIGRLGDYEARATFRGLGSYRHLTAEVNMTDPADVPIIAEALVE